MRTGKDVAVPSLTDEFSTTVATPQGTLRRDAHVDEQRAKRPDGSWAALDDTLVRRSDGALAPAVASEDLVISGGGTGPLATMTTGDGKQLMVGSPFPGALPVPVVSGNSALFRSVAPDTDLEVSATRFGGYTTVLVLHTPEAAANPAVRALSFPTTAKGLELSSGADGSLRASSGGESVFTAPTPQMWSASAPVSSQTATAPSTKAGVLQSAYVTRAADTGAEPQQAGTPSSTDGPGPNATTADIPVSISGDAKGVGAIRLAPSPELLDGAATSYPIYVDPSWSNDARGKSHFTWVQQAYADNAGNFDRTGSAERDRPGVGYQGWEIKKGAERALYEFNLGGYLSTTVINSANLHVTQYVSSDFSCTTKYPVNLYRAAAFDSGVTWNNHTTYEWVDGKNVPGNGGNASCMGTIGVDFSVTAPMRNALANTGVPLAFALVGNEGTGDKMDFKRFDYDAILSAEYDHLPLTPTDPKALPAPRTVNGGESDTCYDAPVSAYRWLTGTGAALTSVVSSYNQAQLTEWVNIWDYAQAGAPSIANGWSGFVPTGSRASYPLATGTLQDGHYYGWQAYGDDGLRRGPATAVCRFAVDTTPPIAAFGTFTDPNTEFPPSGNGQTTNLRLGATGKIPFTASDPNPSGLLTSGLACVRWGYDPQLDPQKSDQICGTPLSVTELTTKPTHWGTNILYAQVFDNAGNISQTVSYSFYVPWAPGPVAFGDTSGDARPDIVVADSAGNLVMHGRAAETGSTSVPPSGTVATAGQAPSGGTWKDLHVTHRGSLDPGTNLDDLFVHRNGGDDLYYYANLQTDPGHFNTAAAVSLTRPNCQGDEQACPDYHQYDTWQYTSQITPIGAPSNVRVPGRDRKNATGFLAVESGNLWYYPVQSGFALGSPNLVSVGGWDNMDLMVPGNTLALDAGANPTTPALWARVRENLAGRTAGDIHQFALTTQTRTDALGEYTVVTDVSASPAAAIGHHFVTGTYPTIGADGDQTGSEQVSGIDRSIPDLWTLDATGTLKVWPGEATGNAVTGIGAEQYRGNTQAPTVQWKLQGNGNANPTNPTVDTDPPIYNATAANLAFSDDTVDGRATKVATFNGNNSTLTTSAPVVDTRQSFTLSTWAKSTGPGGVVASQSTVHASSFILWSQGGTWFFGLANADDNGYPYDYTRITNSTALVQSGVWTQLTASYNASTGQVSLYVNGALAGSGHHAASTSPAPSGNLVLGHYQYNSTPIPTAGNPSFSGSISNFAVYNTPAATAPTTTAVRHASTANCLDVPFGDTNQGVQLYTCNGSSNQQATLNPADASIRLNGKCLDITSGATADGSAVSLWTCATGAYNQTWIPRADGSLYNPTSGRCLDLPFNTTTPGTRLQIWTCNASPAQTWSIPIVHTPALPVNP
ncbi:ricin-type beta-trefoil lectin domain protein [Kitasatospora indigofera]|uniref:ricin-type beta-trefoil lectin domain protein n=1 Tax=Kitasatospora indigofera TaxID=67307 RepID=UPI0036505D9E